MGYASEATIIGGEGDDYLRILTNGFWDEFAYVVIKDFEGAGSPGGDFFVLGSYALPGETEVSTEGHDTVLKHYIGGGLVGTLVVENTAGLLDTADYDIL